MRPGLTPGDCARAGARGGSAGTWRPALGLSYRTRMLLQRQTRSCRLARRAPASVLRACLVSGVLLVVAILSMACAGSRAGGRAEREAGRGQPGPGAGPGARAAASAPPGFEIRVEELPARDRWRIEYRFATPVMGLRFARNRNRYRATRWDLAAPAGLAWALRDDHEEIAAPAPTTRFVIEIGTMLDDVPKDYELHGAFSDGSRLLYTGQLVAHPLVCPTPAPCAAAGTTPAEHLAYRWEFRTAAGRWIRMLDRAGEGALSWAPQDLHDDGTYVYFGNIPPLEDERVIAIIDPGLPAWMRVATRELLPRLFAYYTGEVGAALARRPLLLLSFGGFERPGRSTGGGVLGGVLQLSVEGEGFRAAGAEAVLQWHHGLAHEVFHLWNGNMFFVDLGAHEEWLAEGTAEYVAYRALRDLGVLDEAAFRREVIHAANRCVVRLAGRPLLAAPFRFDNFYTCGMMLVAWADGAVRRTGADIGDVLRGVFTAAAQREPPRYSTYDFLEQIERITAEPLAVGPLERVLRTGVPGEAGAYFAAQLDQAGFPVVTVEPRQATLPTQDFARLLAEQLVRCDCAAGRSARARGGVIEIEADASCNVFRAGARVTHVASHAVADASADAYQALLTLVRQGRPVPLQSGGAALPLRCRADAVDASFSELLRMTDDPP